MRRILYGDYACKAARTAGCCHAIAGSAKLRCHQLHKPRVPTLLRQEIPACSFALNPLPECLFKAYFILRKNVKPYPNYKETTWILFPCELSLVKRSFTCKERISLCEPTMHVRNPY